MVLQTRDGYVWAATFNGVAQFDGVRFRVFNDANTPELRNRLINSLYEDAEGRLWIGSDTGEITWRGRDGFHALAVTNWPSFPIDRFVQGKDGTVWALNRAGLLLGVRGLEPEKIQRPGDGAQYSDLAVDHNGEVWGVRYGGFLTRLDSEGRSVLESSARSTGGYRSIAASRRGGLWVRDGAWLRRWENGKWAEDRGKHTWGARLAVLLYESGDGNVWVGTRDNGAFRVSSDGTEQHIDRAKGLPHDLVSSIVEDGEGNVWIGSDGGGLSQLHGRALFMVGPPDNWQHRAVLSVSPASGGGLWVGTEGAGLYKIEQGSSTNLAPTNIPNALDVRTAVEDQSGRLWVGTQGAGLWLRDGGQLKQVTRTNTGMPVPDLIYAVYEAPGGALWFGTQNGLLRLVKDQWSRLGTELRQAEVRCLTSTPDGTVWVGMRGGGVAAFRDGRFTQYLRNQGMPYPYAWALLGDADNALWIGTPGAGLIRWSQGRFERITVREGLPSDFICSLLEDQQGYLWAGSYAGIFRVSKKDLAACAEGQSGWVNCHVLDTGDGLASLELAGGNEPAACRTEDGKLWFATSGGLAMVDPSRIQTNALPPRVLLEEAIVDGKAAALNTEETSAIGGANLRVPPGSGEIELRYTALSFCDPQRIGFRYRLEEVDSQWVEAGARRAAYYSHLAPGRYRFRVLACNSDGVWNTMGASATLTVLPHYWQTWWFAPCCSLAGVATLGGAAFGAVRRRHQVRIQALERARLVERERGRIARDLHDDLGSGLTDIGSTSELGAETSVSLEEASGYLREIGQRSKEMVGALDEIVWAVNPRNDDLGALSTYFCLFAERLVRGTALQCRFEIPERLPALPLDAEQRHSLFLAFKEALQNVVKHSGAAILCVRIRVLESNLEVVVEDNGKGFVLGTSSPGADGLRNMTERLEQMGGSCAIVTAPGQGTQVVFRIRV